LGTALRGVDSNREFMDDLANVAVLPAVEDFLGSAEQVDCGKTQDRSSSCHRASSFWSSSSIAISLIWASSYGTNQSSWARAFAILRASASASSGVSASMSRVA
jgi:hypothetical protein